MAPKTSPPKEDDSKQTKNVLSGLLIHSCAMMIVPWLLFAGTAYGWFDPIFAATIGVPETHNKNTIAAVLAVVGVNVVVGAFVLTAFREDVPKNKPKKD